MTNAKINEEDCNNEHCYTINTYKCAKCGKNKTQGE